MKLIIENPAAAILRKPSLLKHTPDAEKIKEFKDALKKYLSEVNKDQLENVQKTYLLNFLNNGIYRKTNNINLNGDIDLAIHQDLKIDSKPVVLLEMKAPRNKDGMITEKDLNKTALHEMVYYYMNERAKENIFIKHCIITDYFKWYIFEAEIFETEFNVPLKESYKAFKNKQTLKGTTEVFYRSIAAPHISKSDAELPCVQIDFELYKDLDKVSEKKIVELYKILSPYFLLNEQTHDANRLDERFYKELLHIIGLEEKTNKGKLIIDRKAKPEGGSLLENTITNLDNSLPDIYKHPNFANLKNENEKLFAVAFELCITWVNRILFLKLLEAQLVKYHVGDEADKFHFLNTKKIDSFKMLAVLFHEVLAKPTKKRSPIYQDIFEKVPYLNSSLFDKEGLENEVNFNISNLEDKATINLYSNTILADYKKANKPMNLLEYLFAFLSAYDFSTVNVELVKKSNKPLINASVLGKVFEKINGYKDGSIYTPSFITTYMCRESLRLAVINKFKEAEPTWEINSFDEIANHIKKGSAEILRYNEVVNSIRICDPAVGSGHFLVSALNEMIAIKYDLGILANEEGKRMQHYEIVLADDELVITKDDGSFFEYKIKEDSKPADSKAQQMQKVLFDEKRTIIEQCLFGVDININSVKICSLRLWIELLKNAYYIEEQNFTELETLPNIDINIKCGNSLVSRFELDTDLSSLAKKNKGNKNSFLQYMKDVANFKNSKNREEKTKLLKSIKDIKENITTFISDNSQLKTKLHQAKYDIKKLRDQTKLFVDNKRKKEIENEISELEWEVISLTKEISSIENNEVFRNAFEWRFEFPEVLNDNGDFIGFDLIIGNPPYIRHEEIKHLKSQLRKDYVVFDSEADLLTYFFELGYKVLKPKGNLNLIVSNKFFKATYGKNLRNFLSENTCLRSVIEFEKFYLFDGTTVKAAIINFSKDSTTKNFAYLNADEKHKDLGILIKQSAVTYEQSAFTQSQWIFQSENYWKIYEKISKLGTPLSEWDLEIYRGLTTGKNDAFVINEQTKLKLTKADESAAEIIYPLFRGREIDKYFSTQSDSYVIATFPCLKLEIDEYSSLQNHFTKFGKSKLEQNGKVGARKKTSNKWFETQDATAYFEEFSKPKIIWKRVGSKLRFCYDESGTYTLDSTCIATGEHLKYLVGVLNSKMIEQELNRFAPKTGTGDLIISVQALSPLQIPLPTVEQEIKIAELVDEIIALKKEGKSTIDLEKKIDREVYKLYDLSPEEIKLVEGKKSK